MAKIELVYVSADKIIVHLQMELPKDATVKDALSTSKIHISHPETKDMAVGIYSKLVSPETYLKDGDRIEIYRLLTLDPKEKRRQRARLNK